MRCDDVREKLPEYLADVLDAHEKEQVRMHLATCESCRREAEAISSPLETGEAGANKAESPQSFKRLMRRVRFSVLFRILAVMLAALVLYFNLLPSFVQSVRSSEMHPARRALVLYTQFSYPCRISGYATEAAGYNNILTFYTEEQEGMRAVAGSSPSSPMSYITGKMKTPRLPRVGFVHPSTKVDEDESLDVTKMIETLENNLDNRGATINVSLNQNLSIADVASLLKAYEIKVSWMAVDAGEKAPWGIPEILWQNHNGWIQVDTLTSDNPEEYEEAVIEAMRWLDQNKWRLVNTYFLDGAEVDRKAAYVVRNGINIYGLQISGSTQELLRLVEALDIRSGEADDISFWWPLR